MTVYFAINVFFNISINTAQIKVEDLSSESGTTTFYQTIFKR